MDEARIRVERRNKLEAMMGEARIYADLNKTSEPDTVILTSRGTFEDLERYNTSFTEGGIAKFWVGDGDDDGNEIPLIFDGVTHFDSEKGYWIAQIDPSSYRHITFKGTTP